MWPDRPSPRQHSSTIQSSPNPTSKQIISRRTTLQLSHAVATESHSRVDEELGRLSFYTIRFVYGSTSRNTSFSVSHHRNNSYHRLPPTDPHMITTTNTPSIVPTTTTTTTTSSFFSDEQIHALWKHVSSNQNKIEMYKRKLLVKHIYPKSIDVLETNPCDVLEFVVPYDPEQDEFGGVGTTTLVSPESTDSQTSFRSSLPTAHTVSEDDDHCHHHYNHTDDEDDVYNKIPRCFLTLTHTNETPDHILFKIKINHPKRY